MKTNIDLHKIHEGTYWGKALITFEKSDVEDTLYRFEVSIPLRVMYYVLFKLFRCKRWCDDKRYWNGRHIKMERAAEPTDIFWENLSVVATERFRKSVLTYLITFLVLGFSFTINLFSASLRFDLEKEARENGTTEMTSKYTLIFIIVGVNAIVVALINFSFGRLIRILSSFEAHETYTKYNLSVAVKLTFTRFINTIIIPCAVHYELDDWFTTSGLTTDVFFITVAISFFAPLIDIFEPFWLYK